MSVGSVLRGPWLPAVLTLDVGAGATSIRTIFSSTAGAFGDATVLADATAAAIVYTLPAASTCPRRIVTFKKIDASPNTVTLDGNGSETIDGALTQVISAQWGFVTVQSNGTSWFITAKG